MFPDSQKYPQISKGKDQLALSGAAILFYLFAFAKSIF